MKKILLYVILVMVFSTTVFGQATQYCGDGICNNGETEGTCSIDCRCIPVDPILEEVPIITILPKENPLPVDFYYRKLEITETCGVDGDLDGLLCDPNENYISCGSDCPPPSLDSLLCINEQNCLWRQAWFVKVALLGLVILGTVLYLQGRNKIRRR